MANNQDPFFVIDDSGSNQSLYVIKSGSGASERIIPYSYAELTKSSVSVIGFPELTSSINQIKTVVNNTDNYTTASYKFLTSSYSASIPIITASLAQITSSVSQSTSYIKQLIGYNRATAVESKIFDTVDIASVIDLAETELIPGYTVNPSNNKNYLEACVDVLIQNGTDKNCYVKVSHSPGASLATNDYTLKLSPGVVYNSDSKIANMRHSIYVPGATRGEVSAMMTYNTTLLADPAYPPLTGPNTVYSLAVNYYNFPPNDIDIPNEFYFADPTLYNRIVVYGQARVNDLAYSFDVKITKDGVDVAGPIKIDQTTPQVFSLSIDNPDTGHYEFVINSQGGGMLHTGDGRILFADVLFQNVTPPPPP